MNERDAEELIGEMVDRLRRVAGVAAIALGGSRARGTATPRSDIDLALYYAPDHPLDLDALRQAAQAVDDEHRADALTPIGGWGLWINGGGWLHVRSMPLDLLYRDLHQAADCIQQCRAGTVTIAYQPGHPHGFLNAIYMAEVALCRIEWDPQHVLWNLKTQTDPYPAALKQALIERFFWEARFALQNARKGVPYADVAYVAGCLFRGVSCLTQTLFALNERYLMNEKGAVALAVSFPRAPARLAERVTGAFSSLSDRGENLESAIDTLDALVEEIATLLQTPTP
jgi:hypothetical protein